MWVLRFLVFSLSFLIALTHVHAQGLRIMPPNGSFFTKKDMSTEAKLVDVVRMIRFYYVDSVNNKELIDKAITSLLQTLDPHSSYIPSEQSDNALTELTGIFFGIGIEFSIQKDTLVVMSSIPNTPAERVGIRMGDKFLSVNGEPITNIKLTNSKVAKLLRGPKGTSVQLEVLRDKRVEKYTVLRDSIPLHSVDVSYLIRPHIGYVRVVNFSVPTVNEFMTALAKLNAAGATSFILDFRGNGGGLMPSAIQLASAFLPEGSLVVYAKGRRVGRQDFVAESMGNAFLQSKLVVLVDESTASASEIFSGAMQDWDRAVIVGRRTFGKGLIQNQLAFLDSSLLRITVARYYTPSNRLIQTPYTQGAGDKYRDAFIRRYKNGELFHKDSIHFPDSLKYYTLRTRRPVYGGGGIMPDVFVPLDTVASEYVGRLLRNGLISQWVMTYVTEHRKSLLRTYKTFDDYKSHFMLSMADRQQLVAYCAANGQTVKPNSELTETDIQELDWFVKVFVARVLYSFEYMHRVLHLRDEDVKCALDLLENWDTKAEHLLQPAKK